MAINEIHHASRGHLNFNLLLELGQFAHSQTFGFNVGKHHISFSCLAQSTHMNNLFDVRKLKELLREMLIIIPQILVNLVIGLFQIFAALDYILNRILVTIFTQASILF